MMWWWMHTALAGSPPDNLDLESVAQWEERAFALADGPPGCWNIEGEFEGRVALYLPGSFFTPAQTTESSVRGTFSATLNDGVWTRFWYAMNDSGDDVPDSVFLKPLVGQLSDEVLQPDPVAHPPAAEAEDGDDGEDGEEIESERSISIGVSGGDEAGEAFNVLRASVDTWWNSTVSSSYARWDATQDGVSLLREVPVSDRRTADVVTFTAFFPGGDEHATRIDSILPERLVLGDGIIRATVRNGQLHLQGRVVDGQLFPTSERWGAVFGLLGYTVGYEQRIAYTAAQPCP